jgi:hypothetical protein
MNSKSLNEYLINKQTKLMKKYELQAGGERRREDIRGRGRELKLTFQSSIFLRIIKEFQPGKLAEDKL